MHFKTFCSVGVVCLFAWAAGAQSILNDTTRVRRSLSLDQCVRMALEQNHRLHVIRFDPKIARFELEASKGIYDPEFTSTYRRSSSSRERELDPFTGLPGFSTVSDEDRFTPGLGGTLPTGLRYALAGDFRHSRGTSEGFPFDEYTANAAIQLEQPLLRNFWTDADRTEIQVRKRELKISEMALEAEVRLVIRDVQVVYYELLFSLEDVKVQQKAFEVATNFVAQERVKVGVGNLAEIDLKRAESQAATTLTDLIAAQQRANGADNLLKSLITDKYKDWLNVLIQPTEKLVAVPERLNVYESWALALAERPDLRQLELQGEILRLEKRRRHNQLFPEFNVLGGYGRSGVDSARQAVYTNDFSTIPPTPVLSVPAHQSGFGPALNDISEGANPRWNVGFAFRLPLSRKVERNNYKVAKEEENKNRALLEQLHQTILWEVDNAVDQARADYERISLTRQARVYAEAAQDAEEKRLAAGKGTIFLVLEAQRELTRARSEEIRALTDYLIRLSNLHFRDGTILQRNKVSIRFK